MIYNDKSGVRHIVGNKQGYRWYQGPEKLLKLILDEVLTVVKTDLRILAATNRILEDEIKNGRFRQDLFYRLNVFPIFSPPLRNRKEDIKELATFFVKEYSKRLGKNIKRISDQSISELNDYDWPGNVRELEQVIERALTTTEGAAFDIKLNKILKSGASPKTVENLSFGPITYREGEIQLIMNTLKLTNGKISGKGGAAEILNIHPATLESKMRKFGIKRQYVIEKYESYMPLKSTI